MLRLFSRAHWDVPKTVEQQALLYSLLIPKYTKEPSAQELAATLQAAADAVKPMGLQNADWYISDRMGSMLASNPDLHTDVLLKLVPGATQNPLTSHFWLPSVAWVTEYGNGVPEVGAKPATTPETIAAARTHAVELYLQMLKPETPVMTVSLFSGSDTEIFFRLWVRAPRTSIASSFDLAASIDEISAPSAIEYVTKSNLGDKVRLV